MPNHEQRQPSRGDERSSPAVAHPKFFKPQWRIHGLVLIPVGVILLGVLLVTGVLLYFNATLPKLSKLHDYQPALVTEVYSGDLQKFAEFGNERRFLVDFDEIPPLLVKAFIASEDSKFFQHEGIDYRGVVRAFFKNLQAGRIVQGGSTITQQIAKSLLLSSERSFKRKIKEAMLAVKIEKNLSKNEILYLYLNQIYLGHGSYGVQAAAQNYFNKDVQDLNLAECSLIAGLPQAPTRYSPLHSVKSAKERQAYVLRRMVEEGYITETAMQSARNMPIVVYEKPETNLNLAPDYAEYVRRYLQDKYGSAALYEGGLKVFTTMDLDKQKAAQAAIHQGLEELDRRQGYRGILGHVNIDDKDAVAKFTQDVHEAATALPQFTIPGLDAVEAGTYQVEKVPEKTPLKTNERYRALVTGYDPAPHGRYITVQVGTESGRLLLDDMKWAREPNPQSRYDESAFYVKNPNRFKRGDIILVAPKVLSKEEINSKKYDKAIAYFQLAQEPLVQGALVSMDPVSGFVVAMVGGYDFKASEFNRAVQGARQPGSAFKPIIYAAAVDKGYTASSIIVDSPIVYETQDSKQEEFTWRPKNYEGKFAGDTPFRKALIKSMNVITIKILQDIGLDYVINYAKKLGITSAINRDLSLALGSLDVSLLELTKVYAVFPREGRTVEPVLITKIVDRNGNVVERFTDQDADLSNSHAEEWLAKRALKNLDDIRKFREIVQQDTPAPAPSPAALANDGAPDKRRVAANPLPGYVMSPQTAYLMTYMMTQVVQFGTAQAVKALNRPAAGKTGTTNDETDAWFIGFTPDLLTGIWVGFDQKKPLGRGETGGHAASPMWVYYMRDALEGTPVRNFNVPPKIVFTTVHKDTGFLANANTPLKKRVLCAFLQGSEPTTSEPPNKTSPPPEDPYFLMDSRVPPEP